MYDAGSEREGLFLLGVFRRQLDLENSAPHKGKIYPLFGAVEQPILRSRPPLAGCSKKT